MHFSLKRSASGVMATAFVLSLLLGNVSRAQGTDPNKLEDKEQQQQQDQQLEQRQLNGENGNKNAPKVNPKEEAAYKAFFDAGSDADKRIQLGQDFLKQYPSSVYAEAVHAGMAQAYYGKQDWKNFYAESDLALALKPDDIDLLTMVGWVIPHTVSGGDSDAVAQLDKAETYEKRALQLIPTLPKPANMSDDQFATVRAEKTSQAQSGLGLVYFRRQDWDNAVKELQLATQDNQKPDPTDLFVLGASFQNLGRYSEAADAYTHCSQFPGSLQDRCKQNADNAKKLAEQKK